MAAQMQDLTLVGLIKLWIGAMNENKIMAWGRTIIKDV